MSSNKIRKRQPRNIEAFQLYQQGLKPKEIAKRQGRSIGSVTTALKRIKRDVRDGVYTVKDGSTGDVEAQIAYLEQIAKSKGHNPNEIKHGWLKSSADDDGYSASIFLRRVGVDFDKWRAELLQEMREYAPVYPELKRWPSENRHLLVIDIADLHLGKLAAKPSTGNEYNSDIAVKRAREGVAKLIDRSAGYNVEKVLFVAGNDICHVDGPKHTTTSLTQMIASEMWYESFLTARRLYVELLEMLMQVADVHFTHTMSNHDEATGYFLAQTIEAWFRNCPNITFDVSPTPRKYFQFHNNLIGTTHGHGAKVDKLALLMADEAPQMWAAATRRHYLVHHLHSKIARDYGSVTVEHVRSLSANDDWHNQKGYRSPAGIESWLFCENAGQVARFTHLI